MSTDPGNCHFLESLTGNRYCENNVVQNGFGKFSDFCIVHQPRVAVPKSEVCQKDKSWHLAESEELAKMVEELGDDIYPSDVFTELTELDKYVMRGIEENHPNLLARLYSDAARRTFRIAGKKIRETIEEAV